MPQKDEPSVNVCVRCGNTNFKKFLIRDIWYRGTIPEYCTKCNGTKYLTLPKSEVSNFVITLDVKSPEELRKLDREIENLYWNKTTVVSSIVIFLIFAIICTIPLFILNDKDLLFFTCLFLALLFYVLTFATIKNRLMKFL